MSPVENFKKKMKRRPSYVDDSSKWNPDTEQVLGWIIFSLIMVSLLMAGIIIISSLHGPKTEMVHYGNSNYDTMNYGKMDIESDDEEIPMMNKDFLLKDDVTVEEIYELKRQLGEDQVERDFIVKEEIIHEEVVESKAGNDDYFKDFEKHLFEDTRAGAMDQMKMELMEKNTQLREAEELLEEETNLLMKVSKKLEEFVQHSKSNIETEVSKNESSITENSTPKPKRKKVKKSRHLNPLLKPLETKNKMSKMLNKPDPKNQVTQLPGPPIIEVLKNDEIGSDSSNIDDTLERDKRSRSWGRSSSNLLNRASRFRKNDAFVFDLIKRKNENNENSELKEK